MAIDSLMKRLTKIIDEDQLIKDCDMGKYTSFRTGGKADLMVMPKDKAQLKSTLKLLEKDGTPYMIMGNGSNILVRDDGYRGVVVKLGDDFSRIEIEDDKLISGTGALMSSVARAALAAGLTGFEFASGIPGSLGGAVFMNAGAYDGEMKQIIKNVDLISKDGSREYTLNPPDLEFGYRHSILHDTGDIAVSVTLQLESGSPEEIKERMSELMNRRNAKQPVNLPSAGSFFKRPPGYFAGKLVQDAGLKGFSVGGAQISPLHSGFIVNTGDASATDIIQLMEVVQAAVFDKFGVKLEPEVRIIGE